MIIEKITQRLDELLVENGEIKNENMKISNELAQVSTPSLGNSTISYDLKISLPDSCALQGKPPSMT